jgi:hypothetical protein
MVLLSDLRKLRSDLSALEPLIECLSATQGEASSGDAMSHALAAATAEGITVNQTFHAMAVQRSAASAGSGCDWERLKVLMDPEDKSDPAGVHVLVRESGAVVQRDCVNKLVLDICRTPGPQEQLEKAKQSLVTLCRTLKGCQIACGHGSCLCHGPRVWGCWRFDSEGFESQLSERRDGFSSRLTFCIR